MSAPTDITPLHQARALVEDTIDRNAVAVFGGDAGSSGADAVLARVRSAALAAAVGHTAMRRTATDARAAGATWQQVGEALGYLRAAQATGRPLAELAFALACQGVEPDPGGCARPGGFLPQHVAWRCSTCAAVVLDRGPRPHPGDGQTGHVPGCTRHAAELAEYLAGDDRPSAPVS